MYRGCTAAILWIVFYVSFTTVSFAQTSSFGTGPVQPSATSFTPTPGGTAQKIGADSSVNDANKECPVPDKTHEYDSTRAPGAQRLRIEVGGANGSYYITNLYGTKCPTTVPGVNTPVEGKCELKDGKPECKYAGTVKIVDVKPGTPGTGTNPDGTPTQTPTQGGANTNPSDAFSDPNKGGLVPGTGKGVNDLMNAPLSGGTLNTLPQSPGSLASQLFSSSPVSEWGAAQSPLSGGFSGGNDFNNYIFSQSPISQIAPTGGLSGGTFEGIAATPVQTSAVTGFGGPDTPALPGSAPILSSTQFTATPVGTGQSPAITTLAVSPWSAPSPVPVKTVPISNFLGQEIPSVPQVPTSPLSAPQGWTLPTAPPTNWPDTKAVPIAEYLNTGGKLTAEVGIGSKLGSLFGTIPAVGAADDGGVTAGLAVKTPSDIISVPLEFTPSKDVPVLPIIAQSNGAWTGATVQTSSGELDYNVARITGDWTGIAHPTLISTQEGGYVYTENPDVTAAQVAARLEVDEFGMAAADQSPTSPGQTVAESVAAPVAPSEPSTFAKIADACSSGIGACAGKIWDTINPISSAEAKPAPADNVVLTAYGVCDTPGGCNAMQGPPTTAIKNLNGTYEISTLDCYAAGKCSYVTAASDSSRFRQTAVIPEISFTSPSTGEKVTLKDVPIRFEDTGGAFAGQPNKVDLPAGNYTGQSQKDLNQSLNSQPYSKQIVQIQSADIPTQSSANVPLPGARPAGADAAYQAEMQRDINTSAFTGPLQIVERGGSLPILRPEINVPAPLWTPPTAAEITAQINQQNEQAIFGGGNFDSPSGDTLRTDVALDGLNFDAPSNDALRTDVALQGLNFDAPTNDTLRTDVALGGLNFDSPSNDALRTDVALQGLNFDSPSNDALRTDVALFGLNFDAPSNDQLRTDIALHGLNFDSPSNDALRTDVALQGLNFDSPSNDALRTDVALGGLNFDAPTNDALRTDVALFGLNFDAPTNDQLRTDIALHGLNFDSPSNDALRTDVALGGLNFDTPSNDALRTDVALGGLNFDSPSNDALRTDVALDGLNFDAPTNDVLRSDVASPIPPSVSKEVLAGIIADARDEQIAGEQATLMERNAQAQVEFEAQQQSRRDEKLYLQARIDQAPVGLQPETKPSRIDNILSNLSGGNVRGAWSAFISPVATPLESAKVAPANSDIWNGDETGDLSGGTGGGQPNRFDGAFSAVDGARTDAFTPQELSASRERTLPNPVVGDFEALSGNPTGALTPEALLASKNRAIEATKPSLWEGDESGSLAAGTGGTSEFSPKLKTIDNLITLSDKKIAEQQVAIQNQIDAFNTQNPGLADMCSENMSGLVCTKYRQFNSQIQIAQQKASAAIDDYGALKAYQTSGELPSRELQNRIALAEKLGAQGEGGVHSVAATVADTAKTIGAASFPLSAKEEVEGDAYLKSKLGDTGALVAKGLLWVVPGGAIVRGATDLFVAPIASGVKSGGELVNELTGGALPSLNGEANKSATCAFEGGCNGQRVTDVGVAALSAWAGPTIAKQVYTTGKEVLGASGDIVAAIRGTRAATDVAGTTGTLADDAGTAFNAARISDAAVTETGGLSGKVTGALDTRQPLIGVVNNTEKIAAKTTGELTGGSTDTGVNAINRLTNDIRAGVGDSQPVKAVVPNGDALMQVDEAAVNLKTVAQGKVPDIAPTSNGTLAAETPVRGGIPNPADVIPKRADSISSGIPNPADVIPNKSDSIFGTFKQYAQNTYQNGRQVLSDARDYVFGTKSTVAVDTVEQTHALPLAGEKQAVDSGLWTGKEFNGLKLPEEQLNLPIKLPEQVSPAPATIVKTPQQLELALNTEKQLVLPLESPAPTQIEMFPNASKQTVPVAGELPPQTPVQLNLPLEGKQLELPLHTVTAPAPESQGILGTAQQKISDAGTTVKGWWNDLVGGKPVELPTASKQDIALGDGAPAVTDGAAVQTPRGTSVPAAGSKEVGPWGAVPTETTGEVTAGTAGVPKTSGVPVVDARPVSSGPTVGSVVSDTALETGKSSPLLLRLTKATGAFCGANAVTFGTCAVVGGYLGYQAVSPVIGVYDSFFGPVETDTSKSDTSVTDETPTASKKETVTTDTVPLPPVRPAAADDAAKAAEAAKAAAARDAAAKAAAAAQQQRIQQRQAPQGPVFSSDTFCVVSTYPVEVRTIPAGTPYPTGGCINTPGANSAGAPSGMGNIIGQLAAKMFGTNQSSSNSQSGTPTTPTPTSPSTPATTPAKSAVTVIANPGTISAGKTATLSWSAVGPTNCTVFDAMNAQIGTGNPNSDTKNPLFVQPTTTSIYKITCTGGAGSASGEVTVTVQ